VSSDGLLRAKRAITGAAHVVSRWWQKSSMTALTDGKGSPRCTVRPDPEEDRPCSIVFFLNWPRLWGLERQSKKGVGGWRGGYQLDLNKGCGPRIPTRNEGLICQMHVPIDQAAVLCSERLHRRTPLDDSYLEIVGSGRFLSCTPIFLSNHLVLKGALRSSADC
jgi:hypothetical protein